MGSEAYNLFSFVQRDGLSDLDRTVLRLADRFMAFALEFDPLILIPHAIAPYHPSGQSIEIQLTSSHLGYVDVHHHQGKICLNHIKELPGKRTPLGKKEFIPWYALDIYSTLERFNSEQDILFGIKTPKNIGDSWLQARVQEKNFMVSNRYPFIRRAALTSQNEAWLPALLTIGCASPEQEDLLYEGVLSLVDKLAALSDEK